MESIADKLQATVKIEESRNSDDAKLKEFQQILDEMEKLGLSKKPDYSLPLVDTIGRTYYSALNKIK
jgi:hypothetical protein